MRFLVLALMFIAGGLTGCTTYSIDSKDTTLDFYPPKKNVSDVRYLEVVTEPAQEIGYVSVVTERRGSLEEVLPKLKQEAAMLGADIITDIESGGTLVFKNAQVQKVLGNGYMRTKYTAKALVLK